MAGEHIIVDGATCKCKYGSAKATFTVKSQTKSYINDSTGAKKLIGSLADQGNTFKGKFGKCRLKPAGNGRFHPCIPLISIWEGPYNGFKLGSPPMSVLTEKSKGCCIFAGSSACVEFDTHGQEVTGSPLLLPEDEKEKISYYDPLVYAATLEELKTSFPTEPYECSPTEQTDEDIKFKAYFLRDEATYQGEFGFDWMRQNYLPSCEGGKGISKDFKELEKVYTPAGTDTIWKPKGINYYVPWVSMYPGKNDVKLLLNGLPYNRVENFVDTDIVKLPNKNGVYFKDKDGNPISEVYFSDINSKSVPVFLCCNKPVFENFVLDLTDKDNNVVGKLNFYANNQQYKFNITPVRIARSYHEKEDFNKIDEETDNNYNHDLHKGSNFSFGTGFGDVNKNLNGDFKNLEKFLNENSLNQAQIQTNIGVYYDMLMTVDDWAYANAKIEGNILRENVGEITTSNKLLTSRITLLDYLYEKFEHLYPDKAKERGLIAFLIPLSSEDELQHSTNTNLGSAPLYEFEGKMFAVYLKGLGRTYVFTHEIGHVLGLEHSFYHELNRVKSNPNPNAIITNDIHMEEINKMKVQNFRINQADRYRMFYDRIDEYEAQIKIYKDQVQEIVDRKIKEFDIEDETIQSNLELNNDRIKEYEKIITDIKQGINEIDDIDTYKNLKESTNEFIQQELDYREQLINEKVDEAITEAKHLHKEIQKNEEVIKKTEEKLEKLEKVKDIYKNNSHKFKRGTTDNFMDYYQDFSYGPLVKKKSFYKWQWDVMRESVSKQYGAPFL